MRRRSLCKIAVLAAGYLMMAAQSQASVLITALETGPNVDISGSGTLNTNDMTFLGGPIATSSFVNPVTGNIIVGIPGQIEVYSTITGPATFGTLPVTTSDAEGGDLFGVLPDSSALVVPAGYTSNDPLNGVMSFFGATFASLGMTPGTYTWTWGSGANEDSLTLQIGPEAVVPTPFTLGLMMTGVTGIFFSSKRNKRRNSA